MELFKIQNLSFVYPTKKDKRVLDSINLTIDQGEFITLCGRSGSGKTTLLKHLKSVLTPHGVKSGDIFFMGRPLQDADLRLQSSKIGYVMQNPDSQIVTDKVWHELAFGLESLGTDQKVMRLRVAEMASYFGIQDWFHREVSELSGGQKQLLNLASIMAMQPKVLILDEPTSQLDPIAAADFLNTMKKINRELGTTIIITEHRLEDIFSASDRVIVMESGKIIADDKPENIGAYLYNISSPMCEALPTPVQVYYGVGDDKTCPLTVRQGRDWLMNKFVDSIPVITTVEEENYDIEDIDEPAISLKEVWFRYEKNNPDVLRGTSLKVPSGSIYAIVGGNGTGKSTTLKAICNICKPYRGKVYVNGKNVTKYKNGELFKNLLVMLPQDPQSLFVKKTVKEELEEMFDGKVDDARLSEVAKLCEIEELFESHPYDLSGGEQQRTALAKVLLTNPKILLLDEPTKGMDNFFKKQFGNILEKLKHQGVTVVIVSHDVEFCAKYADYVSMFFDGGVVTTNTTHRFFSHNNFYTTAANRMSREVFSNAITNEDVIELCKKNQ